MRYALLAAEWSVIVSKRFRVRRVAKWAALGFCIVVALIWVWNIAPPLSGITIVSNATSSQFQVSAGSLIWAPRSRDLRNHTAYMALPGFAERAGLCVVID